VTEPVNLRLARKRQRRTDEGRAAEENRARFGRGGAERRTVAGIAVIEERRHAGHRIGTRADDDKSGGE